MNPGLFFKFSQVIVIDTNVLKALLCVITILILFIDNFLPRSIRFNPVQTTC